MALQFSEYPTEVGRETHHELREIELSQPATPTAQTKSALWKYSIWSYDRTEALPLGSPARVIPLQDILPRHTSYGGPFPFTAKENMVMGLTTLPKKKYISFYRNVRWTWFSVYRRLNFLVIFPNVLAMIIFGAQHNLLNLPPATVITAVAANITAGVLIRQELIINILFDTLGKIPPTYPLRIRRLAAKIYHLGGVHSGAGIAATVWYALYNVVLIRMFQHAGALQRQVSILAITILTDVLLIAILILAHPTMRAKFHDAFELVHRFAGWTAVALFWVQFLLLANLSRHRTHPMPSLLVAVAKSPILYLLLTVSISLILPWLRLRKVPVRADLLSDHAVRLHFAYCNLKLCSAPRISDNPLFEWHAFAGIPEQNGEGFFIIISKAGDWTKKIINSPPTEIWVRGIPARGVLHIAPIFKSMVLVATGSGIGPVLSLLYARGIKCRILWSTKDPKHTYESDVIDRVKEADPEAVILNTTISGRPDLVQEAYNMYVASGAEAVFVISNPRVTRKVVYSLESRGVPVFAPIFDS
jgi:hypothetical protein